MIYITGPRDTLSTLKEMSGFKGSLEDFKKQLLVQNPTLSLHSMTGKLPPYSVVFLDAGGLSQLEKSTFVRDFGQWNTKDLQTLRHFQEHNVDLLTQIAMNAIMQGAQEYAHKFRDFFQESIISAPWLTTEDEDRNSLYHLLEGTTPVMKKADEYGGEFRDFFEKPLISTNSFNSGPVDRTAIFDMVKGGASVVAGGVYRRKRVFVLDELYEAMCKRDALNREIHHLQTLSKQKYSEEIKRLKSLAKEQTAIIKQLLPKRLEATLTKYLNKRGIDTYKLRNNSYSMKMAKKGTTTGLKLDFLNSSGLKFAKKMVEKMKKLQSVVDKGALYISRALWVLDTVNAYVKKQDWKKVLVGGYAGYRAGLAMGAMASVSEWGALAIGSLIGEAAVGTAILASSPIWGTALCVLVGAALLVYASNKVEDLVEELWDSKIVTKARHEIAEKLEHAWGFIKSLWEKRHHQPLYEPN